MNRLVCWLAPVLLLVGSGCSGSDGGETAGAQPTKKSSTGGSGGSGGTGLSLGGATGSGGSGGSTACAAQTAKAELKKQPVDIIVVADTSNSMGKVTAAIEQNINTKLADTLKTAQLDYRVVLVAGYGGGSSICVTAPLGGGNCNPIPGIPNLSPSLLHYDRSTGSKAFFSTILGSYNEADPHGLAPNGWATFLRPEAKKVFLAFTDAESGPSASSTDFDEALLALTPASFGTAEARNYVFHSFAGFASQTDPTKPWLPTDPIAPSGCGHPKALNLQELSMMTGGLRFPLCQTDHYDSVFQAVADDVIDKVVVSCELPFPTPPAGETLDPNTIQLEYTSGSGAAQTFGQVKSEADCDASSFYVDADTVHLCPEACDGVQADPQAAIQVEFGCDVGFVK